MDMSTHRQRECRYTILVTTTTITTPTPTKEHVNHFDCFYDQRQSTTTGDYGLSVDEMLEHNSAVAK